MKKYLLIIYAIFIFCHSFGQNKFYKRHSISNTGIWPQIETTPDGGWYICSNYYDNTYNTHLIKYNKCGIVQWSKKLPLFFGGEMNSCRNGKFLISPFCYYNYPTLLKIDQNGNLLFSKKYFAGTSQYYSSSSGEFSNGDLFITGKFIPTNGTIYLYIVKTDSAGNIKWNKCYSELGGWGHAIPCWDGGILLSSYDLSIKMDSLGNVQWSKRYIGTCHSVKPLEVSDGFIYAKYGQTTIMDTSFIYKIDKQGNVLWVSEGFLANDLTTLKKLDNGNFLAVGSLKMGNNNLRPTLIEIDNFGKFISQSSYNPNTLTSSSYTGVDFAILEDGSLIFTGVEGPLYYPGQLYCAKVGKHRTLGCGDSSITQFFPPKAIVATDYSLVEGNLNFTAMPATLNFVPVTTNEIIVCSDYDSLHFNLPQNLCLIPNDSIIVNAPPGFNYLWSTGDATMSLTIKQTGFYTLKIINSCGGNNVKTGINITSCLNVSVPDKPLFEDVMLFPNPTDRFITIQINNLKEIVIKNTLGQYELTKKVNSNINEIQIDMIQYTKGIYFIEMLVGEKRLVRKIVLE